MLVLKKAKKYIKSFLSHFWKNKKKKGDFMPKNPIDVEFTKNGCKLLIQTHPRKGLPYQHEIVHNGDDYFVLETMNEDQTDRLLETLERIVTRIRHQSLREKWLQDIDERLQDYPKDQDNDSDIA